MGLHIGDPGSGHLGEGVERAQLIQHGVAQLFGCHVEVPPTEAGEVRERHLRADRHVVVHCESARLAQDRRVSGVETAGDVGAGDDAQHRSVVAERPHPVRLPQVAVDVDGHHVRIVRRARARTPSDEFPRGPVARRLIARAAGATAAMTAAGTVRA